MDDLGPVRRIVAPGVLVRLAGHAGDDEAELGVRLVLALGAEVKEHRTIGIKDRLDLDTLPIVLGVFLVLVGGAQAPGPEPAADRLFECVVIRFVRHRIVLVGPVQAIANVGQLVVLFAVFAYEVHRDAVVAVLVDDADDGEVNLVHLKLWLVLELIPERAFPLAARQRVEAPILQALQALVAHRTLNVAELRQRLGVQVGDALIVGHSGHVVQFLTIC